MCIIQNKKSEMLNTGKKYHNIRVLQYTYVFYYKFIKNLKILLNIKILLYFL